MSKFGPNFGPHPKTSAYVPKKLAPKKSKKLRSKKLQNRPLTEAQFRKIVEHSGLHETFRNICACIARDRPRNPFQYLVDELRSEKCLEKHKAVMATRIQSVYRSRNVRNNLKKANAATIALQKLIRGQQVRLTSKNLVKKSEAHQKIKDIHKGRVQRKDMLLSEAFEVARKKLTLHVDRDELEECIMNTIHSLDSEKTGSLSNADFRKCLLQIFIKIKVHFSSKLVTQIMKLSGATTNTGKNYDETFGKVGFNLMVEVLGRSIYENNQPNSCYSRAIQQLNKNETEQSISTKLLEKFQVADKEIDDVTSGYLPEDRFLLAISRTDDRFSLCNDEISDYKIVAERNDSGEILYLPFAEQTSWMVLVDGVASSLHIDYTAEDNLIREEAEKMLVVGLDKDILEETLLKCFIDADKDGNGLLDREEFLRCLLDTNIGFQKAKVEAMFERCDVDKNGLVSFREFVPTCFDLLVEMTSTELKDEKNLRKKSIEAIDNVRSKKTKVKNLTKKEFETVLWKCGKDKDITSKQIDVDTLIDCLDTTKLGFTEKEKSELIQKTINENKLIDFDKFVPEAFAILEKYETRRKEEMINSMMDEAKKTLLDRMSREQVEVALKQSFENADKDTTGTLSSDAYCTCLSNCGLGLNEIEIQGLHDECETNSHGLMKYVEFIPIAFDTLVRLTAIHLIKIDEEYKQIDVKLLGFDPDKVQNLIREIFLEADKDNTRSLSPTEFENCLKIADEKYQFGPKDEHGNRHHTGLEKHDIRKIREAFDLNHDGVIEYESFIPQAFTIISKVIHKKHELSEADAFMEFESSDESEESDKGTLTSIEI